jgi:hypothetical protein
VIEHVELIVRVYLITLLWYDDIFHLIIHICFLLLIRFVPRCISNSYINLHRPNKETRILWKRKIGNSFIFYDTIQLIMKTLLNMHVYVSDCLLMHAIIYGLSANNGSLNITMLATV